MSPFIRNFMEVMSFTCMQHPSVMSLESHDPNVVIFGANYMRFPTKLGSY